MITLLVVSLALSATAPIISKNMKTEAIAAKSSMPTGAVIAFDLDTCPDGWFPLTNKYSQATGVFIRNKGGAAASRGSVQLDAAPNITGQIAINHEVMDTSLTSGAFTIGSSSGNSWDGKDWSYTYPVKFDASRSSAVYGRGTEIRPKNITLLYCRKD